MYEVNTQTTRYVFVHVICDMYKYEIETLLDEQM